MDENGQISVELILLVATMSMIVLITAQYTTSYLNDITNHMEVVINTSRDNLISSI